MKTKYYFKSTSGKHYLIENDEIVKQLDSMIKKNTRLNYGDIFTVHQCCTIQLSFIGRVNYCPLFKVVF